MGEDLAASSKACVMAAGVYCGLGFDIPIAATIVAITAVLMVRALVWTKTKSIAWNVAVCGLAMLGSFVTVENTTMSVFTGFWIGVSYGAVGVGIIELGKSMLGTIVADRLGSAFLLVLTGNSDPAKSMSESSVGVENNPQDEIDNNNNRSD